MPKELAEIIATMLDDMMPIIKEAEVEDRVIDFHNQIDLSIFDGDTLQQAYEWLNSIYYSEYQKCRKTKRLLPDHLWERYKSWGDFEGHQEVMELKHNLESLRKRFNRNDRPNLFKRTFRNGCIKKQEKAANQKSNQDKRTD